MVIHNFKDLYKLRWIPRLVVKKPFKSGGILGLCSNLFVLQINLVIQRKVLIFSLFKILISFKNNKCIVRFLIFDLFYKNKNEF